MSRKRRDKGKPQSRHLRAAPDPSSQAEDQELFQTLRRALRSDSPLDLLGLVSTMLTAVDPRRRNPFERDENRATLDDLVESMIGPSFAETTAALMILRHLATDVDVIARIDQALTSRRQPMPAWLTRLSQAQAQAEVWTLTHVLGDGDDYFVGVSLPAGHALSALVHVDHNLGTVVKDAFVVPEPLSALLAHVGDAMDDQDQSLVHVDPLKARAIIEAAIAHGAMLYPPPESDTWPVWRPLVEWMVRMLPVGGVADERKEWSDAEREAMAADFFDSQFGAPLDRSDERDLLDTLLWYGTDYGAGDPLRWSPVRIEILMMDWFPRKIVAPASYLAKMPALLRAFFRYSHDRVGIRAELTAETLEVVDDLGPDYQRIIRSSRPQGPAALLAGLLPFGDDSYGEGWSSPETMLKGLDRKVGGRSVLLALDDQPLPDEPFEWAGIPEDIHPTVQQILDTCDRCAAELLDTELRTAMRRFLSRAAAGDPVAFRRKASPVRGAAAVAWVICRANRTAGYRSSLSVGELMAWFGVKGSASQRAEPLLRANGVEPRDMYGEMELGTPDLLTGECRRQLIEQRDYWLEHSDE